MQEIKRIDYIDVLRSIGILLMIAGHVSFGSMLDYYIHAFHMPMFYIISGYLYKNKNLKFVDYVNRKVRSLLIPYLIFGIFHLVLNIFIGILRNDVNFFSDIYHLFLFNNEYLPIAGGLWFLTSLFFMDLIVFFLEKIKYVLFKYLLIFILIILGNVIPYYFRLPLSMDTAFIGIGLFYIGRYMCKFEKIFCTSNKLIFGTITLIIGSILVFLNGYVNVRQGIYSNPVLFFLISSLMTYGMLVLCQTIKIRKQFILDEMMFIGRNTMVYVCLNQLLILLFSKPLFMMLDVMLPMLKDNMLVILLLKICIFTSTCIVLHIIAVILNKKGFKFIIGK